MKRFTYLLIMILSLSISAGVTSCGQDEDLQEQPGTNPNPDPGTNPPAAGNKGNIKVGSTIFTLTFYDNATADAFKSLLPMSINMFELNSNEKYYNLSNSLPTNASTHGTIQNGDLMLYGSSTLVLFYKTFSSTYTYTRIGRLDNPSGLEAALGAGSIFITFEMAE